MALITRHPSTKLEQLEQPSWLVNAKPTHSQGLPQAFADAKQTTGIEWTNQTWNPMVGCSIHTAGCKNCYAMKQAGVINAKHYEGVIEWVGKNKLNQTSIWTGKINQAHQGILNKPHTIKQPSMIFVNSMSDFFHENMPYKFQEDAMKVMEATPRHVYQILTKRPEEIDKFVQQWGKQFPRNVWVGATMEREDYTHRIGTLRQVPAFVRFLSIEPLIGPAGTLDLTDIHWVIIGGESGPNSREMRLEWVEGVIEQCEAQGVAIFFKQWGIKQNNPIWQQGGDQALYKLDKVGKGGSLVNGKHYKQFPKKYEFEEQ